jgi:hypothetical protein
MDILSNPITIIILLILVVILWLCRISFSLQNINFFLVPLQRHRALLYHQLIPLVGQFILTTGEIS